MPNYCNYEMRVQGKKENVEELKKIMRDNTLPKHFHRVFEFDDVMDFEQEDGTVINHIIGSCAWSVYCCMCEGDESYHDDYPNESTSLEKESERLNLEIEVYSDEPGIGFQEHYHYKDGETLADECVDCVHYYFSDDEVDELLNAEAQCHSENEKRDVFEQWKRKNGFSIYIERESVECCGEYIEGGFNQPWIFSF